MDRIRGIASGMRGADSPSRVTVLKEAPAAAAEEEPLPPGLFSKLLRRVLGPLALGYGICLLDRGNMSMAQLQMADELHLSQTAFGIASSAFFVTYTVLQVRPHTLTRRLAHACRRPSLPPTRRCRCGHTCTD
jgi:hypothetical protein